MTEDRFWELAESGARVLVLGMQWALIWPFVLLGLLASAIETEGGDVKQAPSRSDESAAREAGDAQ